MMNLKGTCLRLSFGLLFLALLAPVVAKAQTQSDLLEGLLSDLQATALESVAERNLQKAIIEFVQNMPEPPVYPTSVRRFMVRGEMALEMNAGPEGYGRAADEYRAATRTAPWLAETYFNLGIVEEKAGEMSAAISAYQLYLLVTPEAANAREIETRVFRMEYQLEAGIQSPSPAVAVPPRAIPRPEITREELLFFTRPETTPRPANFKSIGSNFPYSVNYRHPGKVLVEFDIDENGKTSNFKMLKATRSKVYENTARKVVKKMRFSSNFPQQAVRYDLTFCMKSDLISRVLCDIRFEKVNPGSGGSPSLATYFIPLYNQRAADKGICGNVVVRFDVDQDGNVKNQKILSASQAGQFEINLKDAMSRFRFKAGEPTTGMEYKVNFGLPGRCEAP